MCEKLGHQQRMILVRILHEIASVPRATERRGQERAGEKEEPERKEEERSPRA